MDYRTYLGTLYAQADSGHNAISNNSSMYMDPDVAKNKMDESNINVNIVVPETTVNDLNSQAQAQVQYQSGGGQCAPKRVTIPVYQKEDVYKKAVQIREVKVKCGTRDVKVDEKVVCINDDGLQVSCEPRITNEVKYVPVETRKVSHDVIGGKPPCKIVLPPKPSPCNKPVKPKCPPMKRPGLKPIKSKKRCRSIAWACTRLGIKKKAPAPSRRGRQSNKIRLSPREIEQIKSELKAQFESDYGDEIREEVESEMRQGVRDQFDVDAYRAQLEAEFKDTFLEQLREEVSDDFDVDAYQAQLEAEYRHQFQEEFKEDLENKFGIGNTVNIVGDQVLDEDGNIIGTVRLDDGGNFVGIDFNGSAN